MQLSEAKKLSLKQTFPFFRASFCLLTTYWGNDPPEYEFVSDPGIILCK